MKIKLKLRSHYGRNRYMPACNFSEMMMEIMSRRTAFTEEEVEIMKKRGYEVEITPAA